MWVIKIPINVLISTSPKKTIPANGLNLMNITMSGIMENDRLIVRIYVVIWKILAKRNVRSETGLGMIMVLSRVSNRRVLKSEIMLMVETIIRKLNVANNEVDIEGLEPISIPNMPPNNRYVINCLQKELFLSFLVSLGEKGFRLSIVILHFTMSCTSV